MKYIKADLTADVVGTYDQTKTTIKGNITQKTVNSVEVLGPPLNKFLDVFTDAAITPVAQGSVLTPNGRLFVMSAEGLGLITVALYTINYATGASVYVGKINISIADVAVTTHIIRSIKVIDDGVTDWKIFLTSTASVLINGGTYLINKISLSDFVPVGFPTIGFANSNDAKAVYFLQDPAAIGVGQLQIASAGSVLDRTGNRLYVHNGLAAIHQYYVYDTSIAPTMVVGSITGAAATDIISHAGHTFVDGDPITFPTLVGGAGLTTATIAYFVRDSVPGVSYRVALTTGGVAINFTTDITSGTTCRAFGTTGSNFIHKTGNLPALTGTLLLTDSEDFATPTTTTNAGFNCAFFCTSSNMYLGRLSDLTAGATTWSSLITVNLLGTANQILLPAPTFATWSNVLDKAIYSTAGLVDVMKPFVNNEITAIFGGTNNKYQESIPSTNVVEMQTNSAILSLDVESGWMMVGSGATGQRGVFLCDLRSDAIFDYSYIITKVLDTPNSVYKFINTLEQLYEYTGILSVCYRTSGFATEAGGWITVPTSEDLSAVAAGQQVQFKIHFNTLGLDTSIPAQISEIILGLESNLEISENWEYSHDDSDNGNPSIVAFRLKKAYSSSVPTLFFRAYDLSDSLIVNHNTVANAARFEYSINDGASWNSVGTIPNTVGTLIRYTFSTAPGVDIRIGLKQE